MRKTFVKFCGLSREEDIAAVNRLLPDYAGFVFYKKSKRHVYAGKAAVLKSILDKRIKAVGVFADANLREINEYLERGIIDMVQLHGSEGPEYIRKLKGLTDAEIIKAFQAGKFPSAEDLINKVVECPADHILIDSGQGSGKTFDWEMLKGLKRPYFLAGGLNQDNIKEALNALAPFALDLSSGIETEGVKDESKMTSVMEIINGFQTGE